MWWGVVVVVVFAKRTKINQKETAFGTFEKDNTNCVLQQTHVVNQSFKT